MPRSFLRSRRIAFVLGFCFLLGGAAFAQNAAGPEPVPLPPPIASPADTPYPGTIELRVDLSNVHDRVLDVSEIIPVRGDGEITLLYPQWLPGTHSPSNSVENFAGLVVTAGGKRVPWVRDRVDMYAFHVTVPPGVGTLELRFQYLGPQSPKQGRISNKFADLTWNSVVLYPAGYFARRIQFSPALKLPDGWKFAGALEVKSQQGNVVQFKETDLDTLVDSPVYAGMYFKRVDLSSGPDNKVYLDVFADKPADLEITPDELQWHKNLVIEAQKLFNSHHYDHYDFLMSVSDTVSGKGLEHHQSSEDGMRAGYFTDWATGNRSLLPHEYTHSWNGKFRRPADLWTANFNVPMQNDLLWVYEGLTDYYGNVLPARSAMQTPQQVRDIFAQIAVYFEISPGRTWRPLVDTTNQPIISSHFSTPEIWPSWQRSYDYYPESDLIWLDADTKIRELSGDRKSLDDFARLFFGMDNGSYVTKTYTLDDIVAALDTVQPYDWAGFLRERVYDLNPKVPEDGFTRGGYRLVYNDVEPDWVKHPYGEEGHRNFSFANSLGFAVAEDGKVGQVWWDSLAYKSGITPDMELQAVNDQKFTVRVLRDAILAAEKNNAPIKLLLKRDDEFVTVTLNYSGGFRYAHLERVEGTPARLDAILVSGR